MTKAIIAVATHKDYEFPQDEGYTPIQVGKALSNKDLGITGDDSGDNISLKNKHYCELTALYWLWKNQEADIFGLTHYRRHFKPVLSHSNVIKNTNIATTAELLNLMGKYDVILSSPRNYWIESISTHYKNAHNPLDLNVLEEVLFSKYPNYKESYTRIMGGTKVSLYNMFVMKSHHFKSYCTWLFDILFEVEKRIPYHSYGAYQGRVFGFMAERLLNVWVEENISADKRFYLSIVNLEGENLFKKAIGLIQRKVTGKKIE